MENVHFSGISTLLPIALEKRSFSKVVVLVDENTEKHCLPLIESLLPAHQVLTMPAGESHKTIETVAQLWEQLIALQADRHTLLINLGGGVVTDLGGFLAGTYKRGIPFLNIPTSLLAMVDASVGSKTGIDFGGVKNSIGLFQDAEAVLVDPTFLDTLPERQRVNGYAEILKHGLISNAKHWKFWTRFDPHTGDWTQLIKDSVAVKADVVAQDPKEKGIRKILNFGHTLGHAIEAWSLENEENHLLHGEAIALGMLAEAYLSQKYCDLPAEEFLAIKTELLRHYSPKKFQAESFAAMLDTMRNDKKNDGQQIQFSLIERIGRATYNVAVREEDSILALEYLNTL
ncbi:MAG: 3-dehydroquinate synthase [Saprospiraceae bacterium]|nr:3-dehydroquinate synthase [Saprospiraceae bacterium]